MQAQACHSRAKKHDYCAGEQPAFSTSYIEFGATKNYRYKNGLVYAYNETTRHSCTVMVDILLRRYVCICHASVPQVPLLKPTRIQEHRATIGNQ